MVADFGLAFEADGNNLFGFVFIKGFQNSRQNGIAGCGFASGHFVACNVGHIVGRCG